MLLLFRVSQSDLLTYLGPSRISSYTRALSRICSHTRALSRISSHTRALSRISSHIQAPESDLFTYPGPESDLFTYPALSRISLHGRAPESDLLTYPAISRICLHTRALSRISSHIRAPAHAKEAYSRHGTASFNLSTQSNLPSRIQSRIIHSRRHSRKQSPLGKPSCRSVWGALTSGVSPSGRDNTARQQPIWMHPPFRGKTPQIYSLSLCQSPVLNTTRLSISSEPDLGAKESVNNCNKYQPLRKAFEFSYSLGSKALSNKIDP